MAVHAEQFPVAAVRRVIIVVAVLMVHRQLVKLLAGEFPSAPGADPRQDLERSIPVKIPPPFPQLPRLGKNLLQFAGIGSGRL